MSRTDIPIPAPQHSFQNVNIPPLLPTTSTPLPLHTNHINTPHKPIQKTADPFSRSAVLFFIIAFLLNI